jgi:hypothetical protein
MVFKRTKMNIQKLVLVLFTSAFILNACEKNTDIFIPDPGQINGPDTAWHATVTPAMPVTTLKNNLSLAPYEDTITTNAATVSLNTPFGVVLTFPPNCCVNGSGQIVTGRINVEIQVVKKKGDMVRFDKPSIYNDSMMVTAGHIFIRLKKDGQVLQLAPNARILVRYVDVPVNQQMKFFAGDETNPNLFNWIHNPDPVNNTVTYSTQAYEILTNKLRWISLSQVYDLNTVAKVKVGADIPSYFTNSNTVSYVVFKDLRSVTAMQGDIGTRRFVSPKLPVGKQVTVVVISRIGTDYYLGHQAAVTQLPPVNSTIQLVPVVPVKRSLNEIISYLNSL